MRTIDASRYGPAALELIESAAAQGRPATLPFGQPAEAFRAKLEALGDANVSPGKRVKMPADAACLRAGLWLLFDFFEESHRIAQEVATPSGSYWHAIQHRREPDASNARYWFSRVGEHPVFEELIADAKEIAGAAPPGEIAELVKYDRWDPDVFVKLCTGHPGEEAQQVLLEIQRREWALLFDYNYGKAFAR